MFIHLAISRHLVFIFNYFFFFFSSRRRHTRSKRDWSSDVCSSDLSLSSRSQGEGEKLAKISGGVYYPITEIGQIQRAYEDIVRQLRSAYNITFRSNAGTVGGNGASPRLKIRARHENTFATINSVIAKEERSVCG